MQQQLLESNDVAKLAGCGVATVHRYADGDTGQLPVAFRTPRGERLFDVRKSVLFAVNRRFGLNLKAVDADTAHHVANAIRKSSRSAVADGYGLINILCSMLDDAGQLAVAAAIQKFLAPRQLLSGETGRLVDIVK